MTRQSGDRSVIFMDAGVRVRITKSGKDPTTIGNGERRIFISRSDGSKAWIRIMV
jgi:hypothetical protein